MFKDNLTLAKRYNFIITITSLYTLYTSQIWLYSCIINLSIFSISLKTQTVFFHLQGLCWLLESWHIGCLALRPCCLDMSCLEVTRIIWIYRIRGVAFSCSISNFLVCGAWVSFIRLISRMSFLPTYKLITTKLASVLFLVAKIFFFSHLQVLWHEWQHCNKFL